MLASYTRKLLTSFALFIFLISCGSKYQNEKEVIIKINRAREFLYENHIDSADQMISQIDTAILDEYGLALFNLTQAFYYQLKSNRVLASKYLRDGALYFEQHGDQEARGEIKLLNGFILESALLQTEAAQSYLEGLNFFIADKNSEKYFKCLLGVIRTDRNGSTFLKEATAFLENHPSDKNYLLYLSARSTITKDKREKLKLLLKSLAFFDGEHHKRNLIRLYSNIAKTYQAIDISDSANYYISLSEKLIKEEYFEQQTLIHYYLIRAYIEIKNDHHEKAMQTLSYVFEQGDQKHGQLGYAYLLRSEIYKSKGDFSSESEDLKAHISFLNKEYQENKLHQIGLLKIQLELGRIRLELERIQKRWLISICLFTITSAGGWVFFKQYQKRIERKKYELEKLNQLVNNRLHEQLNVNLAEIKKTVPNINENSKNEEIIKIIGLGKHEFNTYFNIAHPFFREKLLGAYPLLSPTDLKYCDCILADLSVYQTTCILGVTESAVKKARKKLKVIFECSSTTELFLLLKKLDESTLRKVN